MNLPASLGDNPADLPGRCPPGLRSRARGLAQGPAVPFQTEDVLFGCPTTTNGRYNEKTAASALDPSPDMCQPPRRTPAPRSYGKVRRASGMRESRPAGSSNGALELSPGRRLNHPMPALQAWQTCRMPALRSYTPVGLRLAALAAVVACALAAPVLLQPEADGGRNRPLLRRAGAELNPSLTLAGPVYRSRCSAVLRDSAVLRRSLSRCADSFAASQARVVRLALRFRASNRQIGRLVHENTELRARLEATPGTVPTETIRPQPATAGSVNGNMRTAAHIHEPGRNAYPPLPGSGTRPAHGDCVTCCVAALRTPCRMAHCE
jgi:hypothetical protein